jgi:hypothetical protein
MGSPPVLLANGGALKKWGRKTFANASDRAFGSSKNLQAAEAALPAPALPSFLNL